MIALLIMLLNVSGISKRNGRLALVSAGKVCANTLISRLFFPLNYELRLFNIRIPCQKLMRKRWLYAFFLCQQSTSMIQL